MANPIGEDVFFTYAAENLVPKNLRMSSYFAFFRRMISGYMTGATQKQQPWLFAIHDMLNEIAKLSTDLRCSEVEFVEIFEKRGLGELGLNANELLENGINGNFFDLQDGFVMPRVPIVARLARCVSPT